MVKSMSIHYRTLVSFSESNIVFDMTTGLAATLSRSTLLLEAAARSGGLHFGDATLALGSGPSTVSRLLKALAVAGLLTHGVDGRYRTTPRLQRLASPASAVDIAVEGARAAEELAASTGESAAVFVPVDDGVRLVSKCEPVERFRYMGLEGINRDSLAHGFCRLRAAWWGIRLWQRLAQGLPTSSAARDWVLQMKSIREHRWIVNRQDDQPGLGRIAAACVRPDGELVALVGVTATSASIHSRRAALLRDVRAAAAVLEQRCGVHS
jgi:DNA-binding IclR family transcriptional regulator